MTNSGNSLIGYNSGDGIPFLAGHTTQTDGTQRGVEEHRELLPVQRTVTQLGIGRIVGHPKGPGAEVTGRRMGRLVVGHHPVRDVVDRVVEQPLRVLRGRRIQGPQGGGATE